jgi:DsbC/DsbD-like thiol-disulfide interchange protein
MRRLFPSLALAALAIAAVFPTATRAQVAASLVSADASVKPGTPVTVALRLVHKPHWHSYWVNPGTGLPTSLKWTLPAGWTAGDILWPAPMVLTDTRGNVIGNGYDGDLLLPVVLTPPADLKAGTAVEIKADADWLMCQDECVPGSAKLSLTLPIAAEDPKADPEFGARIRAVVAQLPAADPSWSASATRDAKNAVLTLRPSGASGGSSPSAEGLHFFSQDGTTASDLPETVASDGQGGFTLTLPIVPDGPNNQKQLTGVLTSKQGWRADGSLPGLAIDVAYGAAAVTGKAPATSAAPAPPAAGGFIGTLALAFVGGLILNLMPCVFPVLGIKILGFVNQAGADRRKVTLHGLVFASGVLLSFWALAGILAVLRAGGSQLGWGFQLQSPSFVFGLAAAMLAFALNMSGVFEFGLTATGIGSGLQSRSGLIGSFLTGALATVAATPCAAPFLAPPSRSHSRSSPRSRSASPRPTCCFRRSPPPSRCCRGQARGWRPSSRRWPSRSTPRSPTSSGSWPASSRRPRSSRPCLASCSWPWRSGFTGVGMRRVPRPPGQGSAASPASSSSRGAPGPAGRWRRPPMPSSGRSGARRRWRSSAASTG